MNIKQVSYFVAVFEAGSFSVAARSRSVTVQAVSKAIHELENEVQTRLFDRSSQGVTPTTSGRAFYQKARPAYDAFLECENFDADQPPSLSMPVVEPQLLKVGLCSPVFQSSDSLCSTLTAFIKRSTGVETRISIVSPKTAQQDLEDGTYDALVTIGAYEHARVKCVRVGTLPTGVVVDKDHPLATRAMVTMADLDPYSAGVSPTYDDFNDSILTMYRKRGLLKSVEIIRSVAEDDHSFMAERHGFFFSAILPMPGQVAPNMRLIPISPDQAVDVPICFVSLKGTKSKQCVTVENFLIQTIAQLAKGSKR